MRTSFDICIVIPTYNEGSGLLKDQYSTFLKNNPNYLLCFVNDGSTDNTQNELEVIQSQFNQNTFVLRLDINSGKAEAVRAGMLHCHESFEYPVIAFLDADLAVSLDECVSITKHVTVDIDFCFASRIMKLGSTIDRKWSRFLIGRILATIIAQILPLKIYDTQCGCKVFTKALSKNLFSDPFISKWLFDIELFFRYINLYGEQKGNTNIKEIPLRRWIDRGDSKVKPTYFFKLWSDLLKIRKTYKAG